MSVWFSSSSLPTTETQCTPPVIELRETGKKRTDAQKKKKREAEAEPFAAAAAQLLLVTYMYVTPIIRRSRIVMKYHVSLRLWHRKKEL